MITLSDNDVLHSKEDNTRKYKFYTKQDVLLEAATVFFNDTDNAPVNICISSQIGCKFNCSFCACGNMRFNRNLTTDEIIKQIELIFENDKNLYEHKFEVTYMGSGDPLDNFDAVTESMFYIPNYQNLNRINISTIIPTVNIDIAALLKINKKIHFQYSLNFVNDTLRSKYLQNNNLPSIEETLDFLEHLAHNLNDNPCISYILFNNVNDSKEDAILLCKYAKKINAYLKISEYIPVNNSPDKFTLEPSRNKKTFCDEIDKQNVDYKLFKSKGIDIKAACGHFLSDIVL